MGVPLDGTAYMFGDNNTVELVEAFNTLDQGCYDYRRKSQFLAPFWNT
jgi:hypothetical protein